MCFARLSTRMVRAPGDTFGNSQYYTLMAQQCCLNLHNSKSFHVCLSRECFFFFTY